MKFTSSMKENHLFRRLYAKGKHVVFPSVALYARPNHSPRSRLGLTVGVKVGNAVRRNKVRRRLREIYRTHENELTPGWDIVAVARTRAAYASFSELKRDMLRGLDKLEVRKKP